MTIKSITDVVTGFSSADDNWLYEAVDTTERQSAGAMLYCPKTKRFLLGKRSKFVEQGGTWSTFGGGISDGESMQDALTREMSEETGYDGEMTIIPSPLHINKTPETTYTTVLVVVPDEFDPKLNWETDESGWFGKDDFPTTDLHPGFKQTMGLPVVQNKISSLF